MVSCVRYVDGWHGLISQHLFEVCMSGSIVILLDSTTKVSEVVESGVVIQDNFSNIPLFIKNEALAKELFRSGPADVPD